jgi:hypothetical protein
VRVVLLLSICQCFDILVVVNTELERICKAVVVA